ncbi:MAG: anhydro-N-acetylmuramic acid kinase [Nitrospirota bacterium]|jgi:anhydro-N-acetylmuramic acid kinase
MRGRLILGLMSGTSHDGVDAALVGFSGKIPRLLGHTRTPYSKSLRESVRSAFGGTAEEVCRLNFALGEVFARAALRCLKEAGAEPPAVDAIASHGQTICHIPPRGRRPGSTLQIGEPAVIAQRTGIKVVSDFRTADMALGGHGAPLVPFADHVLFKRRATCCVQNIGGIANVTVVTPDLEGVFAFDTGPGACLIDEAMRALFGKPLDRGGKTAAGGRADAGLLKRLRGHRYFGQRPPKSTGRELFGTGMLQKILKHYPKIRPEDLVATFTHLTALSIKDAYERFVFPEHGIREVILSGGGARNAHLVALLREALSPLRVRSVDDFGVPAEAKEALSFAVLAKETLRGRPSSIPRATGASRSAVLGKITYP